MAILFDDASTQYFTRASAILTATPITMAGWTYGDDRTVHCFGMSITDDTGSQVNFYIVHLRNSGEGGGVRAAVKAASGPSFRAAVTTNDWSADTWHHVAGIFTSSTSRRAVLDGDWTNSGTNTDSTVVGTPNRTSIAILKDSSAGVDPASGRNAEWGIWNAALTEGEIRSLAAGMSPLRVRPGNLKAYYPLYADSVATAHDYAGQGLDMSQVNSPTAAGHAPVAPPFGVDQGVPMAAAAAPPATRRIIIVQDLLSPAGVMGGAAAYGIYQFLKRRQRLMGS